MGIQTSMTNEQLLVSTAFVAAVVIVIVYLLKKKNFRIKGSANEFEIDSQQPTQRPGISVRDVVARDGSVKVSNSRGDGIDAERLDAAKDVVVRNTHRPKK